MKIDLHCHTKKIKKGDPVTRNVSPEMFAEKVKNADVRIVAITNHNVFDYDQYNIFRERTKDYCEVWPGIELDAYGDSMKNGKYIKFHLIVIANPTQVDVFSKQVNKLLANFDVEEGSKHISDIYKCFRRVDALYIPHYLGKKPAITDDDLELLKSIVSDPTRVFTETTESSIGVLVNNDFHALVGSDVRDWNDYEDSMFSDLRLPVSSFEQFCLLAKRDVVVINTLLNKKKSYILKAKPHSTVTIDLKIYEDVNVIFGQKGTGKSEILSSLYDSMTKEGFKCVNYTGSQKEKDFEHLLNTADMKRDCKLLSADDCEKEFEELKEWRESNITLFSYYQKWMETRNHNANKKSMRLTDAIRLACPDDSRYQTICKDRYNLTEATKKISLIDLDKYLKSADKLKLESIIQKLGKGIYDELVLEYIKNKAVDLTNYSIDKIKELADKNTDTVSKPSTTGFFEYAQTHIRLKKATEKIMGELKNKAYSQDTFIGELEGKGRVYVRSMYRMLNNSKSNAQEYSGKFTILKKIKRKIEEIHREYYSSDISIYLDELKEFLKQAEVSNLESFIGISKYIVDDYGAEYEPSNGEKGILLLQQVIMKEADAYFFDEPELGMGNSYIDSTIRPQISDLARRHKVVFVATHNANLAVRTLPYMSIFRKHENGNYSTYTGNPFRNELVNIDDDKDMLNWTYESMHTLEGGKEAFYERKEIYESGND